MRLSILFASVGFLFLAACAPQMRPLATEVEVHDSKTLDRILSKYGYVDPGHIIPDVLLQKALVNYDANLTKIANKDYLSVVDFSAHSSKTRFYVIDMKSGKVQPFHVAHGKGSDPGNSGYATKFSNASGSGESSVGLYETAETYNGAHGYSLRLDGLSSTNSNVRDRAIVIHGAAYVYDKDQQAGRSLGCLAVSMSDRDQVVSELKGGSLIYAGLSQAQ